ncbi:MAG: N-acetyltransferase [Sphingobacteriales bacterium]|nr:N-acetyltransferase [Sphingobacteriales bacterium]MBI3720822.1 N-acetyltransferase [Sphingobacteriales bacterium]
MNDKVFFIHQSSVIDPGAQVGKGTQIWHFCHIRHTAEIGEECKLGQNIYVDENVKIGNRVKIQNNVSVYNGVIIEDDVFLGPSMVFTNVINPRSFIERKDAFKKTLIKKGATIGANATIICGVEIGEYALVGAGAVVTKNIPAYALFLGNPGQIKGWVSRAGITLRFDEKNIAVCSQTGEKYQLKDDQLIKL